MTRQELIQQIQNLIDSGEMVSIEGYRYKHKKSREWAVKRLSNEEEWARIEIDSRVYYIKK